MEDQKVSMLNPAITYGALLAVAVIIFSLVIYLTDMTENPVLPYFSYVIMLAGVVMAAIAFRNNYLGGYIEFGQAYKIGFLTIVFASILIGIYTFFYYTYINLEFFELAQERSIEVMEERGMADHEIEQGLAMTEMFQKPWIYAIIAVFGNILLGLLISLATYFAVKKPDPFIED